ncbi:heavy metal sensor histidine kinase [Thorsellia kenyensis]|uniref:Sensor protein n=1 Tax=Thorsellia kenyensis TaxID=1549888 RepID=A0ABV6CC58_9GAMM
MKHPHRTFVFKLSMAKYLTLVVGTSVLCLFLLMTFIVERSITHHFIVQDRTQLESVANSLLGNKNKMQKMMLANLLNNSFGIHHSFFIITSSSIINKKGENKTLNTILHPLVIEENIWPELKKIIINSRILQTTDSLDNLFKNNTLEPFRHDLYTWNINNTNYRVLIVKEVDYAKKKNNYLLNSTKPHQLNKEQPPLNSAIIVGLDISFHQEYLKELRYQLISLALIISFLSMIIVHYLIKRGLIPIKAISDEIKAVQGGHLSTRISDEPYPIELKPLIASFNHLMWKLDTFFEQQARFSEDIAHELRTPMTNLITQTQIILQKERNKEEYQEALYGNLEEFERLSKMVNDMLFLANTDALDNLPDVEQINLIELVNETIDYFDALSEINQQKIYFDISGIMQQQTNLSGNKSMLKRAISNILSNAFKYSIPHTDILVATKVQDDKIVISFTNQIEKNLSNEQLCKLFDRFYRVDPSRNNNEGKLTSIGIGLAMTKVIINAHKGSIEVSCQDLKFSISISI